MARPALVAKAGAPSPRPVRPALGRPEFAQPPNWVSLSDRAGGFDEVVGGTSEETDIPASAPALIRDWDLLQSELIPRLLEVDGVPRAWSIGSIEDAVTLAVAFEHAQAQEPASESMELYVTEGVSSVQETGFSLADLRCVPSESKSMFVRRERRWVADPDIAGQVVLSEPSAPVDLVTMRSDGEESPLVDEALDQLRRGGQLLVICPEGSSVSVPAGTETVAAAPFGRILRKCGTTRSRPKRSTRHTNRVRPETLAHKRAQDDLVDTHMQLARSLARRFVHHGEPADDLEQVALLALVKAAKRFDPGRNTRFATYATSSILGELKRHFRDKTWMLRVPRPLQELYLSVKQARDDLSHTLKESPTVAQIATHLGVTEEAVLEAMGAGDNFWPASLDGRTRDEPGTDVPVIDTSIDQSIDRIQVQQLLPSLDHRERVVLRRVYFDSLTQREVAAELGVSQMQVSRLLARAVAKLQD